PWLLPNARTPRFQKPVLQPYRLSPYLRETGRWPLRGEGQWRVGIRSSRQNLEAVGAGPWISRLCSLQIRWATRSPLLCRCPARNLGFAAEPADHRHRRLLRARRDRPHCRAAEHCNELAAPIKKTRSHGTIAKRVGLAKRPKPAKGLPFSSSRVGRKGR